MWIAASVRICAAVQWPLASLTLWGVLCLGILQVALETQRKKNTDSISSRHSASVPKWRQYTAVELGFDPNAQPDARCGAWAISPQRHCCCCTHYIWWPPDAVGVCAVVPGGRPTWVHV